MSRHNRTSAAALVATALLASLVAYAQPASAQPDAVRINEFVASNQTGPEDGHGETSDWIELHNPSSNTVSLQGWSLRNGASTWPFPAGTSIAAGGFVIVWASNDDPVGGELHASFKLSAAGESLHLLDSASQVIDSFAPYPVQQPDVAYGVGANGVVGYLESVTFGAANSDAVAGQAAAPTAAVGRGQYSASVTETLASASAGASIRYTLDGTRPTATSTLYTGPITIDPASSGIVTIRAIATGPGLIDSHESSWSYVFPAAKFGAGSAAAASFSDRPVVSVYSDDASTRVNQNTKIPTRLELIDDADGMPGFSIDGDVKEFGESGVGSHPTDSMRFFFDDDTGPGELEYPIYAGYSRGFYEPPTTFTRLELRNFSWDALSGEYLNDPFWHDTMLDLGVPARHNRFTHVFYDGTYKGVYQIRERFDAGYGASYLGGSRDDYESTKVFSLIGRGATVTSTNDGDGSISRTVLRSSSYDDVRGIVDIRSFLAQAMVESVYQAGREGEYRFVGPIDSASPHGMIVIENDLDWIFRLYMDDLRARSLRGNLYQNVTRKWISDDEVGQELQDLAAFALCEDGPMTGDAMVARLQTRINELRPMLAAQVTVTNRWAGQAAFDTQMADALDFFNDDDGNLRTGMEAAGQMDGCNRPPAFTMPPNMVSAQGQALRLAVEAVDPDGDAVSFTVSGLPAGLTYDSAEVEIVGAPTTVGSSTVTIVATDANGDSRTHDIDWVVLSSALGDASQSDGGPAIVLNEFNGVAPSVLWAGTDSNFGSQAGNGGDWFELVVSDDDTDMRGVTVELWDRDRASSWLEKTDSFTFGTASVLADLRAGTIITVAESVAEDASYDPSTGDWQLAVNASNAAVSSLLAAGSASDFNTNANGFRLMIRDADGVLRTPVTGETETWRAAALSAGSSADATNDQVFALCTSPAEADLIADYRPEGATSTFGGPNVCDGVPQSLADLRGTFGDVDCSGQIDGDDIRLQLAVLIDESESADFASRCVDETAAAVVALADLDRDGMLELSETQRWAQCVSAEDPATCALG